ncbi:MAG: RHS repeat protein [Aestuariibacter sp.]|nr:RHS repeat protein [Aestuariibacter sp.]
MTAYIAPDVGEVSHQTDLTYNDAQELLRVDRPDGKFIEYGYDYAGRLGSITTTQGVYLYDYDVSTGNLNSMTTPGGGQVRYDYNNYLINKTTWTGMVAGTVERTYDANGRVDSLGVNGSDVVSFQFNEDGQLTQAGVLNISYDTQTGLLTGTDAGMASDALGYNSFGEALNYTMQYNGGDVYAEVYSYDDLGRISTKTETINRVATTYGYTYDLAGRLSQVRQNGALIADYSYDVNGNRLAETIAGLNGTYDDQDRLLTYGPNTYNYTANGELTRKVNGGQTTAYQYDEFSNLISVTLPDTTPMSLS